MVSAAPLLKLHVSGSWQLDRGHLITGRSSAMDGVSSAKKENTMKRYSTISSAGFSRALFAGLLASLLMGFSGYASAESWAAFESKYDYEEAVHYMNKGYSEIGKVNVKLDEAENESALVHFNRAMKDFNKALVKYSDAELPAADKSAVELLSKGLDALLKSTKALEKDDIVAAQDNYDIAQDYFAGASILLD